MEQLKSIAEEDLEQIKNLFGEFVKKYYEDARETLPVVAQDVLDENIARVSDEMKQSEPSYERLVEIFRVLKGNLLLINTFSPDGDKQMLPLLYRIENYFENKKVM